MNEKIDQLIDAPIAVRAMVVGGVAALLVGIYWLMFFSATQEELSALEADTKRIQTEVSEKQRIAANLPKFEKEVERLDVELKKALTELPDQKEIPQLLEKIADKAKDSGLDVQLFRPKTEQRKDFYAEVPVEIEVAGGFHQVATFFDEVSRLERIVNIDSVSMTDPKMTDSGRILKTALVATSFRFLDEKERPKEEEGEAKKRRKKPANKDE